MAVPTCEAYLASLPKGLDSYPECQQKAAFMRQLTADNPSLREIGPRLPAPLASLLTAPPPVSTWIPEVHVNALCACVADLALGEDGFAEAAYQLNARVLRGPLYRVMMMMVSPSRMLRLAASRWDAFHRGSRLKADVRGDAATLTLSYPLGLMPRMMARSYALVYKGALEAAGGESTRVEIKSYALTLAIFEASWR